ncbi:MAG TPA: hypothetical protein VHA37_04845, partial [Candidatus Saccharimonadales bacterium]|nr:hypothetical protein [Candidatus Saccharimonadales bacterium]
MISGFNTQSEVSAISVANATASLSTTWESEGASSAALTFKAGGWAQALVRLPATQNWSWAGGLAVDLSNRDSVSETIAFQIDDDGTMYGSSKNIGARVTLPANATATVVIPFAAAPSGSSYGMKCVPPLAAGGHMLTPWGTMDLTHVVDYRLYTLSLPSDCHVLVDNVRLVDPYTAATFTAIVDKYGQPTDSLSPTKITADTDFADRTTTEQAWLNANPVPSDRDSYGGWASGPTLAATGYFRTTYYNSKWWLVTPSGHLFFSSGMNAVIPSEPSITQGRETMFSSLPLSSDPYSAFYGTVAGTPASPGTSTTYDFYGANLQRKYGSTALTQWTSNTSARLKAWGFNTDGWSYPQNYAPGLNMPYCIMVSYSGSFNKVSTGSDGWGPMVDPYDPAFAAALNQQIPWYISTAIGDPNCLGYFVDNELSWAGTGSNARYALAWGVLQQSSTTSPAKTAFISALQTEYGTIGALNSAWNTSFASWTDAGNPWTVQSSPTSAATADLSSLSLSFARKYFSTIK